MSLCLKNLILFQGIVYEASGANGFSKLRGNMIILLIYPNHTKQDTTHLLNLWTSLYNIASFSQHHKSAFEDSWNKFFYMKFLSKNDYYKDLHSKIIGII